MKRLRLHIRFNRATKNGDLQEALKVLRQLQRLPTTPWGTAVCETLMLRTGVLLRDWPLVEETWERYQGRSSLYKKYEREASAYYAAGLADRGYYKESIALFDQTMEQPRNSGPSSLDSLFALAKTNALIRLGDFERARATLDRWHHSFPKRTSLGTFARMIRAHLDFLEGYREQAGGELLKIATDPQSISHFRDPNVLYSLVRSLCRCGLAEPARALFPTEPGNLSSPKSRELRMLAAAALAEAENNPSKALSYYSDLRTLGTVDGEAYVRASALCLKEGRRQEAVDYLQAALDLDPQSHWAHVAHRKLEKLSSE